MLSSGQYGKAIPELIKLAESDDFDPSVYGYLGYAYFQTKKFDLAKEYFLKMSEVQFADKALWHFNAGTAALEAKDFAAAEDLFSLCLAKKPEYKDAYLNRGNSRIQLGRYEEALSDYTKYLELSDEAPQSEEIQELIKIIEIPPLQPEEPRMETTENADEDTGTVDLMPVSNDSSESTLSEAATLDKEEKDDVVTTTSEANDTVESEADTQSDLEVTEVEAGNDETTAESEK